MIRNVDGVRGERGAAAVIASFLVAGATACTEPAGGTDGEGPFPEADPEEVGLSSERLEEAVRTVEEWVDEDEFPGAVIYLVRDGRTVLHEAVGWDRRDEEVPMREDQIVLMRSMTKPLVGTAIMMLREEGHLSLEDRVSDHLPAWDTEESREVTIFQLLTHTSGITGGIRIPEHPDLAAAIDAVGERGPEHEPGTGYHYSDANSSTLGRLVHVITGTPPDTFMEERILEPLGMEDSYFQEVPPEDPRFDRTAVHYRAAEDGEGWELSWAPGDGARTAYFGGGAGGLYSSAEDYARFAALLLHEGEFLGERLLEPGSIEEMTAPQASYVFSAEELENMDQVYGLHLRTESSEGEYTGGKNEGAFGHGGAQGTLFWVDPTDDLIGIVLSQARNNDARRRVPELIYTALTDP